MNFDAGRYDYSGFPIGIGSGVKIPEITREPVPVNTLKNPTLDTGSYTLPSQPVYPTYPVTIDTSNISTKVPEMVEEPPTTDTANVSPVMSMAISGANFLTTLFYIWNSISDVFGFEFTKSGFTSSANNGENTICVRLIVKEKNLLRYNFNPENYDDKADIGPDADDVKMYAHFHTTKLHAAFRACGKVNIVFMMYPGDATLYYVKTQGSSVDDPRSASTIMPHISYTKVFETIDYGKTPIVKICVSEFVGALNDINRAYGTSVVFVPYPKGLHIAGIDETTSKVHFANFGICEGSFEDEEVNILGGEINKAFLEKFKPVSTTARQPAAQMNPLIKIVSDEDLRSITIRCSSIKAFSRLHTVCPESGIVSFFYKPGAPLKMTCDAGVFGELEFFFRNGNSTIA